MKAFVHHDNRNQLVPGSGFVAAEVRIDRGSWVVFAKAEVRNVTTSRSAMECILDTEGIPRVPDKALVILESGTSDIITLSFAFEVQGLPLIRLKCSIAGTNEFRITNITISAIPVDSVKVSEILASPPPHPPFPAALGDEPNKEQGYE